jgi:capsular polysaccharide biosynthesis protein
MSLQNVEQQETRNALVDIKLFLRVLLRRWRIIVAILIITVVTTVVITELQPPTYTSAATYVVSPSARILNGTGFLSGLSVLGGQPTVANTLASIAGSASVKQKASEALGLTPAQAKRLSVTSRVQTGTSVIEITTEGNDPALVQTFTNKIGEATLAYVSQLNGVYDLALLDGAVIPEAPSRPNKRLNLILAVAIGLALGVGVAFLAGLSEY